MKLCEEHHHGYNGQCLMCWSDKCDALQSDLEEANEIISELKAELDTCYKYRDEEIKQHCEKVKGLKQND